jgi:AraC-like DNA-binding protein
MKEIRRHFTIYPVNTPGLLLRGYGVQEIMNPGMVNRPGGIDVYLLLYFYTSVDFEINNKKFTCPPQSMILLEPGLPHKFGNGEKSWNHSWLLCKGTKFHEQVYEQKIPLQTVKPLANSSIIENYLLNIEREQTSHAKPNADIIWNSLHSCLIEIGRAITPIPSDSIIPDKYLHVKQYLDTHYTEDITLSNIAKQVHQSIPRFCNSFKHYFGQPPISYVICLRMQEAAYLLRDMNLSITEISAKLGYADLYYFSRQFRQHYGMSPRQMRKNN